MTTSTVLAAAVVAGALLLLVPRLLARSRNSLRMFQDLRAQRNARYVDWALITAYHRRFAQEAGTESLDDRTWRDLDLDALFLAIDHTASEPGRQTSAILAPLSSSCRIPMICSSVNPLSRMPGDRVSASR